MTPEVTVIIIAYRTRELILRLLANLDRATAGVPYEVIVVDNGCPEGSADVVAKRFPAVRLLRLADNVGFARAVNACATQARGRWLLLLNPDTEPVGDPLGELLTFARAHPEHLIYAGRTLREDGTDDARSVFGLPSLWSCLCFATGLSTVLRRWRWTNPEELPGLDRSTAARVPAASGCLLLIRRSLFEALDGFDPVYFMYGEDTDLCQRAARLGASPVLVPGARVIHFNGAASSDVAKRVMLMRGKITYLRRRWSPARAWFGCTLLAAGIAVRATGARLTGRAGYWAAVWVRRDQWLPGWPAEPKPTLTVIEPRAAEPKPTLTESSTPAGPTTDRTPGSLPGQAP